MTTHLRFALALAILMICIADAGADFVLVDADGSVASIVLPASADKQEQLAARELADHVRLITGATLPITNAPRANERAIYLGVAADAALDDLTRNAGGDEGAIAVVVTDDRIDVRGLSPSGTLFGVYELLERLGVRWYMPGELGTVVPQSPSLSLPPQTIAQSPSFVMRRTNTSGTARAWTQRMRLGGHGPPNTLRMPDVGDIDIHPERYALVNGKRNKAQLCVTNPETIDQMAARFREYFHQHPSAEWFAIGNHGGDHCECDACRAIDPAETCGPYTGGINVTDRYLAFVDKVFEQLGDDLPDKRIALTVAGPHMCAPVHRRGNPRMDVIAWTAPYCRMHGVNNPVCAERMMVFARINDWITHIDGDYYERSNWGNIAGPGLLFPGVHRYRRDMPDYHTAGVKGFTVGAYSHWISENPSMYIAAKLLWNCDADVDAMLDEFYHLYYGPAANPMRQYHELIEAAMRDTDRHAGTGLDIPHVFTPTIRAEAHRLLDAASQQADGIYKSRIAAVRLALDYTDSFCAMIDQRNGHNYAASAALLDKAHGVITKLCTDYQPGLLNQRFAETYLDLFFGNIVRAANECTTTPNRLIVVLDDTWRFRTDPQQVGEREGWWKPDADDAEWKPIHAYSDNWSGNGLRYYQGDAWYRQSVMIPKEAAGLSLRLWFGAVDEQASVWLNGRHLGDSDDAVFVPFEFPIGDAVRFGEVNVIAVRTRNVRLDELGTGGLLAPVFIYASGD